MKYPVSWFFLCIFQNVKMRIEDEVGILCPFIFPNIIPKYIGSLISLDIFWLLSKLGHPTFIINVSGNKILFSIVDAFNISCHKPVKQVIKHSLTKETDSLSMWLFYQWFIQICYWYGFYYYYHHNKNSKIGWSGVCALCVAKRSGHY